MDKEFDMIIFGATGFTGKYIVEYLAKIFEDYDLKWAVAGRNLVKLEEVLKDVSSVLNKDVRHIEKIEADVTKEETLKEMCQRTKLVVNCVGPFRFYGEPVVKACIESGCHHVDISAEAIYLESMLLKYHEKAQKSKVYIVEAVGYGSIPSETGIQFLQQHFNGDVNSVEIIYGFTFGNETTKLHYGTYDSVFRHLAKPDELIPIRQQLYSKPLPENCHPEPYRRLLSYREEINKWCLCLHSLTHTDDGPLNQTQYYNYHNRKMRPVHIGKKCLSFVLPNLVIGLLISVGYLLVNQLIKARCIRYIALKHPKLCSGGRVSHEGPSRHQVETSSFITYVIGTGYHTKLSNPDEKHLDKPEKKMMVSISGPDAGYKATAIMVIQSALTIIQEKDKLPEEGGVFSCGAAFLNTTLISRLQKEGITYKVEKEWST